MEVEAKPDAGPFEPVVAPTVAALPDVSTIPALKLREDGPTKVPLAIPGQVSVGDMMVIPLPTRLLAKIEAERLGVTTIWPKEDILWNKPESRKTDKM